MRRRTVLWSIAGVLSVTAGLWATDWALLYWVAIPFVYRAAPLPESQVLRGIPYDPQAPSDGKRQLDLFLPSGRAFPTVVFVPGGGWTTGDRTLTTGGADVYANIGRFLASRGFAAAVVSYRLLWDVDWRTQAQDVARAVGWVQRSIEARGGRRGSIFLMGHSAGAQLVTRLAIDRRWLAGAGADPASLCGVVAVSGAGYDMVDPETYRLGADPDYYAQRFGGSVREGPWRQEASPITYFDTTAPPFLVMSAEGESAPLRRQSRLLAERLLQRGVPASQVLVPGSSHERMVVQLSRDDQTAGPAVLDFLQQTSCP